MRRVILLYFIIIGLEIFRAIPASATRDSAPVYTNDKYLFSVKPSKGVRFCPPVEDEPNHGVTAIIRQNLSCHDVNYGENKYYDAGVIFISGEYNVYSFRSLAAYRDFLCKSKGENYEFGPINGFKSVGCKQYAPGGVIIISIYVERYAKLRLHDDPIIYSFYLQSTQSDFVQDFQVFKQIIRHTRFLK